MTRNIGKDPEHGAASACAHQLSFQFSDNIVMFPTPSKSNDECDASILHNIQDSIDALDLYTAAHTKLGKLMYACDYLINLDEDELSKSSPQTQKSLREAKRLAPRKLIRLNKTLQIFHKHQHTLGKQRLSTWINSLSGQEIINSLYNLSMYFTGNVDEILPSIRRNNEVCQGFSDTFYKALFLEGVYDIQNYLSSYQKSLKSRFNIYSIYDLDFIRPKEGVAGIRFNIVGKPPSNFIVQHVSTSSNPTKVALFTADINNLNKKDLLDMVNLYRGEGNHFCYVCTYSIDDDTDLNAQRHKELVKFCEENKISMRPILKRLPKKSKEIERIIENRTYNQAIKLISTKCKGIRKVK